MSVPPAELQPGAGFSTALYISPLVDVSGGQNIVQIVAGLGVFSLLAILTYHDWVLAAGVFWPGLWALLVSLALWPVKSAIVSAVERVHETIRYDEAAGEDRGVSHAVFMLGVHAVHTATNYMIWIRDQYRAVATPVLLPPLVWLRFARGGSCRMCARLLSTLTQVQLPRDNSFRTDYGSSSAAGSRASVSAAAGVVGGGMGAAGHGARSATDSGGAAPPAAVATAASSRSQRRSRRASDASYIETDVERDMTDASDFDADVGALSEADVSGSLSPPMRPMPLPNSAVSAATSSVPTALAPFDLSAPTVGAAAAVASGPAPQSIGLAGAAMAESARADALSIDDLSSSGHGPAASDNASGSRSSPASGVAGDVLPPSGSSASPVLVPEQLRHSNGTSATTAAGGVATAAAGPLWSSPVISAASSPGASPGKSSRRRGPRASPQPSPPLSSDGSGSGPASSSGAAGVGQVLLGQGVALLPVALSEGTPAAASPFSTGARGHRAALSLSHGSHASHTSHVSRTSAGTATSYISDGAGAGGILEPLRHATELLLAAENVRMLRHPDRRVSMGYAAQAAAAAAAVAATAAAYAAEQDFDGFDPSGVAGGAHAGAVLDLPAGTSPAAAAAAVAFGGGGSQFSLRGSRGARASASRLRLLAAAGGSLRSAGDAAKNGYDEDSEESDGDGDGNRAHDHDDSRDSGAAADRGQSGASIGDSAAALRHGVSAGAHDRDNRDDDDDYDDELRSGVPRSAEDRVAAAAAQLQHVPALPAGGNSRSARPLWQRAGASGVSGAGAANGAAAAYSAARAAAAAAAAPGAASFAPYSGAPALASVAAASGRSGGIALFSPWAQSGRSGRLGPSAAGPGLGVGITHALHPQAYGHAGPADDGASSGGAGGFASYSGYGDVAGTAAHGSGGYSYNASSDSSYAYYDGDALATTPGLYGDAAGAAGSNGSTTASFFWRVLMLSFCAHLASLLSWQQWLVALVWVSAVYTAVQLARFCGRVVWVRSKVGRILRRQRRVVAAAAKVGTFARSAALAAAPKPPQLTAGASSSSSDSASAASAAAGAASESETDVATTAAAAGSGAGKAVAPARSSAASGSLTCPWRALLAVLRAILAVLRGTDRALTAVARVLMNGLRDNIHPISAVMVMTLLFVTLVLSSGLFLWLIFEEWRHLGQATRETITSLVSGASQSSLPLLGPSPSSPAGAMLALNRYVPSLPSWVERGLDYMGPRYPNHTVVVRDLWGMLRRFNASIYARAAVAGGRAAAAGHLPVFGGAAAAAGAFANASNSSGASVCASVSITNPEVINATMEALSCAGNASVDVNYTQLPSTGASVPAVDVDGDVATSASADTTASATAEAPATDDASIAVVENGSDLSASTAAAPSTYATTVPAATVAVAAVPSLVSVEPHAAPNATADDILSVTPPSPREWLPRVAQLLELLLPSSVAPYVAEMIPLPDDVPAIHASAAASTNASSGGAGGRGNAAAGAGQASGGRPRHGSGGKSKSANASGRGPSDYVDNDDDDNTSYAAAGAAYGDGRGAASDSAALSGRPTPQAARFVSWSKSRVMGALQPVFDWAGINDWFGGDSSGPGDQDSDDGDDDDDGSTVERRQRGRDGAEDSMMPAAKAGAAGGSAPARTGSAASSRGVVVSPSPAGGAAGSAAGGLSLLTSLNASASDLLFSLTHNFWNLSAPHWAFAQERLLPSMPRLAEGAKVVAEHTAATLFEVVLALVSASASALSAVFSALLFTTLLFYLLSAQRSWLDAILSFHPSEAGKGNVRGALAKTVQQLFLINLKLLLYHALFTYLAFSAFGVPLVYTATAVHAVFAALPLFPSWLVAALAGLYLTLSWHWAVGLAFAAIHTVWLSYADYYMQEEVRFGHPIVIGLSIVAGVTAYGAQGAIIGPLLVSVTVACYMLLGEALAQSSSTSSSSSAQPTTGNSNAADSAAGTGGGGAGGAGGGTEAGYPGYARSSGIAGDADTGSRTAGVSMVAPASGIASGMGMGMGMVHPGNGFGMMGGQATPFMSPQAALGMRAAGAGAAAARASGRARSGRFGATPGDFAPPSASTAAASVNYPAGGAGAAAVPPGGASVRSVSMSIGPPHPTQMPFAVIGSPAPMHASFAAAAAASGRAASAAYAGQQQQQLQLGGLTSAPGTAQRPRSTPAAGLYGGATGVSTGTQAYPFPYAFRDGGAAAAAAGTPAAPSATAAIGGAGLPSAMKRSVHFGGALAASPSSDGISGPAAVHSMRGLPSLLPGAAGSAGAGTTAHTAQLEAGVTRLHSHMHAAAAAAESPASHGVDNGGRLGLGRGLGTGTGVGAASQRDANGSQRGGLSASGFSFFEPGASGVSGAVHYEHEGGATGSLAEAPGTPPLLPVMRSFASHGASLMPPGSSLSQGNATLAAVSPRGSDSGSGGTGTGPLLLPHTTGGSSAAASTAVAMHPSRTSSQAGSVTPAELSRRASSGSSAGFRAGPPDAAATPASRARRQRPARIGPSAAAARASFAVGLN